MLFITLVLWGVIVGMLSMNASSWSRRIYWRWILGGGGSLLIFESFFFECWVRLAFPQYLVDTPEIIKHWIPKQVMNLFLKKVDIEWMGEVVDILHGITLNGALLQLVPTLSLAVHVFMLLPLALAGYTLVDVVLAAILPHQSWAKWGRAILLGVVFLNAVGLLVVLPELNGLGAPGNFQYMLIASLLNTELGAAPWLTLVGLILLAADEVYGLSPVSAGQIDESSYLWDSQEVMS